MGFWMEASKSNKFKKQFLKFRVPTCRGRYRSRYLDLLLLPAFGHVDLEGLVPLDDRAPPEAQEDHAAPNEQPRYEDRNCDAGNCAAVHAITPPFRPGDGLRPDGR